MNNETKKVITALRANPTLAGAAKSLGMSLGDFKRYLRTSGIAGLAEYKEAVGKSHGINKK